MSPWWAVVAIIVIGLVMAPVYRWRARRADETERAALERANRLTAVGFVVLLVLALIWAVGSSL